MKTRVISSIVCLVIGAAAVILGGIFMELLIIFFAIVGLHEFYSAMENKGYKPIKEAGLLYIILLLINIFHKSRSMTDIYFTEIPSIKDINFYTPVQLFIVLFILTLMVLKHRKYNIIDGAVTIFGGFYVVFLISYFMMLRNLSGGVYLFALALIGAISSDTTAFFVGKALGKKKLIPEVSPKKTVAGGIGAVIGPIVILTVYGLILTGMGAYNELSFYHYAILGIMIGFVSQLGDLSASAIKRYTGIKDFGRIIPGHGGILDRIDSYLFVIPVVYYYVTFLGLA